MGKNKLVDRMLELMNEEREYMQLHRYRSTSHVDCLGDYYPLGNWTIWLDLKHHHHIITCTVHAPLTDILRFGAVSILEFVIILLFVAGTLPSSP